MTEASSFLQELNEAVLRGSRENRARALWHATDLLIAGRYTEDQIWVFGEVIGRLADEIELAARAKLAKLLAHSDTVNFELKYFNTASARCGRARRARPADRRH